MNNSTNTGATGTYFGFGPSFQYPVVVCHILIVVVAVVGNLMVCYAIITNKSLRSNPTNLFIFSLAFSDLLTVSFAVPFDIEAIILLGAWSHGEELCKAWITIYLITVPTSILTLLAVSVDRYKSLSDPLNRFRRHRFMTRKRALIISILIWLYSFLFALLPIMGWRLYDEFVYEGVCYFPFTKVYTTLSSVVNFILPLLITCGIYIKIYLIARAQQGSFVGETSRKLRSNDEKKVYTRNIQAAKTISIFVAAFFFCWIPFSSISITASMCEPCVEKIPHEANVIFLMFGYLNSALNPFLFAFRNSRFQATFTGLVRSFKVRSITVSTRRRSTMTQSTCHSEVPDIQDSEVRLHLAKAKRDSLSGNTHSSL